MNPAVILLAAFFTGATSWSIGLLALQALRVRMHRHDALLTAWVLGSAGLSLIVFAMLVMWIARPWWFALVGCSAIGLCLWRSAWRIDCGPAPAGVPWIWKWIFSALLAIYGTYTFLHALAPEVSPDGLTYHLGTVARWFRTGGFEWYTGNMYANMPMGIEMLFLFAYSFGRHSAAALVHWQFYLILPLLLLNIGRRTGHPAAGAVAGLLFLMTPVASVDGASAYVDVATAAVLVTLFSLLLLFESQPDRGLLIPIGVLGGFAYTCKMTAFPAVPFALAWVGWVFWVRHREPGVHARRARPEGPAQTWTSAPRARHDFFPTCGWKSVATVAGACLMVIAPWLLKSTLMAGNPFSPFLNRVFPNPYVRVSFEEEYREYHRTYYGQIKSPAEIPKEVTVKGAALQGLLGPVFLLAPVALVALRWRLGRQALFATIVFAVTYPSNIGTRFLLLPLPFLSLAMALVFSHWRGTAAAVVLFHAYMSWPAVLRAYSEPHAWALNDFRWMQALRIEPEEQFHARVAPNVLLARLIEQNVPPHGRVLTYGGVAEAHTSRDILVVYQAGFNNLLGDILAAGMNPVLQGSQNWLYQFEPVRIQKLRLVQTKAMDQQWAVSEMRIYPTDGSELPRTHVWRLRAHPNPWEVQLAFDNCPITRWMTAQATRPGDFLEVDFVHPVDTASVMVQTAPDQQSVAMRVEAEVQPGIWKVLSNRPKHISTEPVINSRLTATDDLKRFGVTHLAIGNNEFIAQDLYRNQAAWGIALIGEVVGARVYQLE